MNVRRILIDDSNPQHRELSIYRTGAVNRVRLQDETYKTYGTIELNAHDYAALFHYGVTEALNALTFISESGNGLDSWDEAFLPSSSLPSMRKIIRERMSAIPPGKQELILLGWQDQPVGAAYLRKIETDRFVEFLASLVHFLDEASKAGDDLEFML
ncbi:MAG: hypothetical protein WCH05_09625 [Chlorobiaceae bacterium]